MTVGASETLSTGRLGAVSKFEKIIKIFIFVQKVLRKLLLLAMNSVFLVFSGVKVFALLLLARLLLRRDPLSKVAEFDRFMRYFGSSFDESLALLRFRRSCVSKLRI